MSQLALSVSLEYLCYGSTAIKNMQILSARGSSESDVYRLQILTHKDGPRAERVNEMMKQPNSDPSSL